MKIVITSLFFFLLVSAPRVVVSQTSSELNSFGETIISSLQAKKSEWKYESVSPMSSSDNVILQQWSFENESVRIAVVSHASVRDAVDAMQVLARGGQRGGDQQLGEEDVTWGRGTVSFRKRNLTVNVSVVITEPTLDLAEARKHEINQRKIAKEFAHLVASAIKDK
ncbi:MAG: hypothetical protein AABN95_22845 [Acidobacteriota bacterium]